MDEEFDFLNITKLKPWVIYLTTTIGLLIAVIAELHYVTDGLWDITWSLLWWDLFPIPFVFVGIVLMATATFISIKNGLAGSRIAFVAAILTWPNYVLVVCGVCGYFLGAPLFTINGIVTIALPISLLTLTTIYSRIVIKLASSS